MSILDQDLSELADSPSQEAWPSGTYVAGFSVNIIKKDPARPTVICNFKFLETQELANPADADEDHMPKQVGKDQTAIVCALMKKDGTPNDMGQGALKDIMKVFVAAGYPSTTTAWAEQVSADKPTVAVTFKRTVEKSTGDGRNSIISLQVL